MWFYLLYPDLQDKIITSPDSKLQAEHTQKLVFNKKKIWLTQREIISVLCGTMPRRKIVFWTKLMNIKNCEKSSVREWDWRRDLAGIKKKKRVWDWSNQDYKDCTGWRSHIFVATFKWKEFNPLWSLGVCPAEEEWLLHTHYPRTYTKNSSWKLLS